MNDALAASPLARAVGFALLEFVWQGAVIGAAAACLLVLLRRATAQSRYLVACLGLAVMLAAPIVTVVSFVRSAPAPPVSPIVITAVMPDTTQSLTPGENAQAAGKSEARPVSVAREWIDARLPFVLSIWSGGVLVLTLHLFSGWVHILRLRRRGTTLAANRWPDGVRLMADRLGVTRRLRLIESALVDVPAVVGFLRPAIVVPASALLGLPPAHLDAILAHELAHVHRGDYLVNVVQCVAEILLFYHPAVWWVSRQIRLEREHCCDDLAVTLCPDRVAYARALASLEELRSRTPALAMSAGGGELLNRIRRLVEPGSASGPRFSGGFAMTVMMTVLLLAVSGQIKGMPAGTDRSDRSIVESSNPIDGAVRSPASSDSRSELRRAEAIPAAPRPQEAPNPKERQLPVVQPPLVQTAAVQATAGPAGVVQIVQTEVPQTPVIQPPADQLGQPNQGKISGMVQDKDGGVIPGATVTLLQRDGGRGASGAGPISAAGRETSTVLTNASGRFLSPLIVGGSYDLTVSMAGFRTSRHRVQVTPNETVTANIRLELASVNELVLVTGRAPSPAAGAPPVVQAPSNPGYADHYFDTAKLYYQQGRIAEAEAMTMRALEALRSAIPPAPPTSNAPATPGLPIRVGGSIRAPRQTYRVEPVYPSDALAARVEGFVVLEAIIAKDGTVKDVKVASSVPMLDDAALGAVRQWRYTPTQLNGVPVEVLMTVTIKFSVQ